MGYELVDGYRVYSKRWLVLAVFVGVSAANQFLWSKWFSITTEAWKYYGYADAASGEAAIAMFSTIVFAGMIVFSFVSFAAFDKFGWYKTVSAASVLMGVCALIAGIFGDSYNIVLISTVGVSITQPFILNSLGIIVAKWFPVNERGRANGVSMLSLYIGLMIGLYASPAMLEAGLDIKQALMVYGVVTAVLAAVFIICAKEAPETPPCAEEMAERVSFINGLKVCFKRKNFIFATLISFMIIGIYGVFNTLIGPILSYFNTSFTAMNIATVGTILTIGSIVGTIVLPTITDRDKLKRRLPSMRLSYTISIVAMLGIAFAGNVSLLYIAAFVLGFFMVGAQTVIMIFAAESGYPASEGTTEGIQIWIGNFGSIVLMPIIGMFGGIHSRTLYFLTGLLIVTVILMFIIKEGTPEERHVTLAEK